MNNSKMKVLVVDDDSTMRMILRAILGRLGFPCIEEAVDGLAALQMLRSGMMFDLVFTDWEMPNMFGIDLVRNIRADSRLTHLPVVMMTATPTTARAVEAAKAGADGFLVKPFTLGDVSEQIETILAIVASREDMK